MLTILAFLFPMIAGVIFSVIRVQDEKKRNEYYILTILVTDLLGVLAMAFAKPVTLLEFSENVTLSFGFDGVGRYILATVLILYTAVTFYAFEYMTMEENPNIFFAFFFLSLGALIACCGSSNLVTVYLCFETATLASMPLVLHERTKAAVAAAAKYLFYSVAGALLGLLGIFYAYYYGSGGRTFVYGGFLDRTAVAGHEPVMLAVTFLAVIGFGTKAGMYPMHGWLPTAHPIAPAPASALLSGIIAKAGVLAIIRLVYFSIGADFLRDTWVQTAWSCLAMLTIFMGSMMAFREKILKKRLAYSTVSQISYILLGLSMMSEEGLKGGLIHLMGHASAKGCLFLVAGVFIYKLGRRNADELKGVGAQMPITLWCFLLASLSLVGIPPMAGFLSKWVIASSAIQAGHGVMAVLPVIILLISALLTAGYLLPIAIDGFFPVKTEGEEEETAAAVPVSAEPSRLMTIPMMCLCIVALLVGVFGGSLVEVLL